MFLLAWPIGPPESRRKRSHGGDKEEPGEVTNETRLIDFSFSGDHSAQPSVLAVFGVRKRRDNGRVTPGAGALQTRPSERRQLDSLDARGEKHRHSSHTAACTHTLAADIQQELSFTFTSQFGSLTPNRQQIRRKGAPIN